MALSHPPSPSPPSPATRYTLSPTATLSSTRLPASHFAAYHTNHRDLCRHAASLPRQLSEHVNQLHTLRSTSRTFSSHLARLLHPPLSPASQSVLQHFTGVTELLRVALMQQLDTALTMLAGCVDTLAGNVDSLTRLCDSLRTAAMAVDVQLLALDAAAVREWETIAAGASGRGGGGSAGGSHRKQRPDKKQSHRDQQDAENDDSDPALTAPVSPYTLLLTLEDVVYTLSVLQQQHTAALVQLQTALKESGEERSEAAMTEALDMLSDSGEVNSSVLEEWLSIIRRACKV